ncbi:MAG: RNA-guided pseudouridylation complex pseudouridine synthase subunit Cbf5 [Candidatus Aenigmarchaeota archaeon]|nr:RNA-guided pseudouridylation complex pseudouridine synthase subunit Cbf5 [Candidatus Aenigmarchaeota archaeon]
MKRWLIKSEEALYSNDYPGARSIDEHLKKGIIIIDKPSGPTSRQIDLWVKEITGVKKCSHGGTLDPRASGVLVIALEKSTKLMPILLSSKKEYVGVVNLHKEVSPSLVQKACKKLVGKITQLPPVKSSVARKERKRTIYILDILEIDGRNILIKVKCEAGTYIRRLGEQIGKELGVDAHLQELRRISSGGFTEDMCITLQELYRAFQENNIKDVVKPLEIIGDNIKKVIVKTKAAMNIRKGAPLYTGGIVRIEKDIKQNDVVGMFSVSGSMIGFGKAKMTSKDMIRKKGLAIKTDRII